jgi:putative lipoic acid-binding regulatory protein
MHIMSMDPAIRLPLIRAATAGLVPYTELAEIQVQNSQVGRYESPQITVIAENITCLAYSVIT